MFKQIRRALQPFGDTFPWMAASVLCMSWAITASGIPDSILWVFAGIATMASVLIVRRFPHVNPDTQHSLKYWFGCFTTWAIMLWLLPVIYYFASLR